MATYCPFPDENAQHPINAKSGMGNGRYHEVGKCRKTPYHRDMMLLIISRDTGSNAMDVETAPLQNEYAIAAPGEPIVNITAYTARQQASGYVGSEISHLMGGGDPALLLTQGRVVWRVPILLSSPRRGILGQLAHLDIDARTGQMFVPPDFISQIETHAQALLDSSPPTAAS